MLLPSLFSLFAALLVLAVFRVARPRIAIILAALATRVATATTLAVVSTRRLLVRLVVFERMDTLHERYATRGSLTELVLTHSRQMLQDRNQAVGIQGRVMLLTQSEGSLLPVRHLLALANFVLQDIFCYLG